jgi:hypothetical protein
MIMSAHPSVSCDAARVWQHASLMLNAATLQADSSEVHDSSVQLGLTQIAELYKSHYSNFSCKRLRSDCNLSWRSDGVASMQ